VKDVELPIAVLEIELDSGAGGGVAVAISAKVYSKPFGRLIRDLVGSPLNWLMIGAPTDSMRSPIFTLAVRPSTSIERSIGAYSVSSTVDIVLL